MDDLDLVKMRLSRIPLDGLTAVSMESGVPYGTIWNIKTRKTKNPRYPTVRKLADYFKRAA
jgi:hypothetical protein